MARSKKQVVTYEGIEKVRDGRATVYRDPVRKGDKFECDAKGAITQIYRDGELLYAVGQVIGDGMVIVHLEVDPNPGNMLHAEVEKEGYAYGWEFDGAFVATYGEDALWRPAWRVECETVVGEDPQDQVQQGRCAQIPMLDEDDNPQEELADLS